jgi:hypothetical protein
MDIKFQIFGSASSQDLDCMVFVNEIPNTQKSHELCDEYAKYIQEVTGTYKEINTNICVLSDGVIVNTFKGTEDEVNNSLFLTYDLHKQYCPKYVERMIKRDVELKILRTCRVILSFWSRSEHRPRIKEALRGDVHKKIEVLSSIDSTTIESLGKNVEWKDYLKVMAFQLGQTIGLIDGMELYTKEDIALNYPELEPYLMREDVNSLDVIEDYKNELLDLLSNWKFINTKEKL